MQYPSIEFKRSDGKTYRFDDSTLWISQLEGLAEPVIEIFTEKRAIGHGEVVTGARMGGRTITMTAVNRKNKDNGAVRRSVGDFFRYGYTYDIGFEWHGVHRAARGCLLKGYNAPTTNIWLPASFQIMMYTPDAWLTDGGLYGQNAAAVTGTFGFPYVSLQSSSGETISHGWSVFDYSQQMNFENDGVAPTWCRAVFTASGDVLNPRLTHNGAFIRVLLTLHDGDELVIDTERRKVTLNGQSVMRLVDRESSFAGMEMGIGQNIVGYAADEHDNLLAVQMFYEKRYLSI